jgi:hypoxanthine-guanine phosphoribosyltransferase
LAALHGKGAVQPHGSLLFPAQLVKHRESQIETDYAHLTNQEKESDREQVRKYLPVIATALSSEKD